MALINCNECNNQISSNAASCPQCGNPLTSAKESKGSGTQLYTQQETSKRLKLHSLFAIIAICASVVWIIGIDDPEPQAKSGPVLLFIAGFIWYLITRARIWWHHK